MVSQPHQQALEAGEGNVSDTGALLDFAGSGVLLKPQRAATAGSTIMRLGDPPTTLEGPEMVQPAGRHQKINSIQRRMDFVTVAAAADHAAKLSASVRGLAVNQDDPWHNPPPG
jgi:hypothetical protein